MLNNMTLYIVCSVSLRASNQKQIIKKKKHPEQSEMYKNYIKIETIMLLTSKGDAPNLPHK